jgi:hypothetical protein
MTHYVRSHGLSNDYIVMDPKDLPFDLTPNAVRLICDRNRGVGSDGILVVSPGQGADFGVRILNPDGSEAEKSGNGVRIFAKFLREHGYTTKDRFTLHTLGGRVTCVLEHEAGRVAQITVDMGKAKFDDFDSIEVEGRRIQVTSVSVGNPHCVVIVPDVSKVDVRGLGPEIERHKAFPNRADRFTPRGEDRDLGARRRLHARLWLLELRRRGGLPPRAVGGPGHDDHDARRTAAHLDQQGWRDPDARTCGRDLFRRPQLRSPASAPADGLSGLLSGSIAIRMPSLSATWSASSVFSSRRCRRDCVVEEIALIGAHFAG